MPSCRFKASTFSYSPDCRHGGVHQVNPIINTWYDASLLIVHGLIKRVIVWQTDNLAANNTIEFRATIDGLIFTGVQVAANNTLYHIYMNPTVANDYNLSASLAFLNFGGYVSEWYHNAHIEVRLTTAPNNPSILHAAVFYGDWRV
jgi:hypothetical protein